MPALQSLWFRAGLVLAGLALCALGRSGRLAFLVPGTALVLLGFGSLFLPGWAAACLLVIGGWALGFLVIGLFLAGYWEGYGALAAAAALCLGVGGLLLAGSEEGLADLAGRLAGLR